MLLPASMGTGEKMSETNTNPEAREAMCEAFWNAAFDDPRLVAPLHRWADVSASTKDAVRLQMQAAISAHTKALAAGGMVIVKVSDLEALPAAGYDAANGGPLSIRAAERAYLHLKSKVGDMIPTPTLPPAGEER